MEKMRSIIRREFKKGDDIRDAGLTAPDDVIRYKDIAYGKDSAMQVLDVYRPKDTEGNLPVIVSVHGGGWVYGDKELYQYYCMSIAQRGFAVVNFTYRLAPEYPFPAALEDAVAAYKWLRDKGYESDRIIVVGDSAGGGLAMALCMELRTNGEPMPAGLVAMSPWTDLAITGESYTKNREIDPVFGADGGGEMLLHSPYIGENDAKNPLISPMYGNFTGFPPMLIQVGTHEMLYDDAASVAKKAKEQGVPVRFTVYEGMFHVFQMSGTVIPESKRAWEEVGTFMHKVMGQW